MSINSKESLLVHINNKESLLVSIRNTESLLVHIKSKQSLLVSISSAESLLVTLHRAIRLRAVYVPPTCRLRSAHVLFVEMAVAVRRGGGGQCRL